MVAPYEVGMSRQTNFASTVRAVRQRVLMVVAAWALLLLLPSPASASFLSPEMEDVVADWLTVFVLILVPVVGIALFWMVHILPEQIAHKRHHPQLDAIRTLCLLSLVFGGLLWPLAWLWAFTKPIGYRMAYGTDKHDDYFDEMAAKHREGKLLREEARHLREELEAMEARGALPPRLRGLKDELATLRAQLEAEEKAKARA
jgi:CBS domain containing-hemolysin-like protein